SAGPLGPRRDPRLCAFGQSPCCSCQPCVGEDYGTLGRCCKRQAWQEGIATAKRRSSRGLAACRTGVFGAGSPRAILANRRVLCGWIGSSSRLSGRIGVASEACYAGAGTLGGRSGGGEDEHPLQVPHHGHEAPLGAHFVETAQRKLAESESRLDD